MATRSHSVMWTSGWDSTFRVADLLLTHGRAVTPWYVHDRERPSARVELDRLAQLRAKLEGMDPTTRDRLGPLRVVRRESLPPNPEVASAFGHLRDQVPNLGIQHGWLPLLATAAPDLEWCVSADDARPLRTGLRDIAVCRAVPAPDDCWYVPPSITHADLHVLFGAFRLPLLGTTKDEMRELADRGGFGDILADTWSCFQPTLSGAPCGRCRACTNLEGEPPVQMRPQRPARTSQVIAGRLEASKVRRAIMSRLERRGR